MQEYVIPEGNINITDTSAVNVADYATAQVVDADLVPGNVKSGVNILGVQGSVVELNSATTTVHSGATQQTVTPTAPANGFTSVTVEPLNLETKTMPLGAQAPATVTPTSGKDGLSSVAPSIDSTVIKAANIKSGATILGVAGSVTELNGSTAQVKSTDSQQIITPTAPSNGFTSVVVQPVDTAPASVTLGADAPGDLYPTGDGFSRVTFNVDSDVVSPDHIRQGSVILGVEGEYAGGSANLQSKSVTLGAAAPASPITADAGGGKNIFNVANSRIGANWDPDEDGYYNIFMARQSDDWTATTTYQIGPVAFTGSAGTAYTLSFTAYSRDPDPEDPSAIANVSVQLDALTSVDGGLTETSVANTTVTVTSVPTRFSITMPAGAGTPTRFWMRGTTAGYHPTGFESCIGIKDIQVEVGTSATAYAPYTPPYDGLSSVSLAIDSSVIKAGNIKSGVSVLGVTGDYSGEPAILVPTSITLGADAPTTVMPPSAGSGKNKFNIAASGMGTIGTLQQDGSYFLPGSGFTGSWSNYASSGDVADGGTCLWLADESTRDLASTVGSYSFKVKTATADTGCWIQVYEVYEYRDRVTGAVVQRLRSKRSSGTVYITSTDYTSITYSLPFGWYQQSYGNYYNVVHMGLWAALDQGGDFGGLYVKDAQMELNNPSTSYEPYVQGADGFSQVSLPVDSTVIKAENIKSGVNILGVAGSLTPGITPTGNINITDTSSTDVTNYATAQVVDTNLTAENIKSGVNILGVSGSLTPGITPTGNINITDTNSTDVTNYATAQVVDANLTAGNIKKDVAILGVTGSYEGSGGGSSGNDVVFYDYDGTVVQSYSANDFLALSAMPANPTHSGLTAQGWNWSLSDAKTYVQTYGKLNIG